MALGIVYRDPAHPNAKPSPVRRLVIWAPAGTVFAGSAVPRCQASDTELMTLGGSACPAASQVGAGTLVAVTGFGPPIDPYTTDLAAFNDGHGLAEVVSDQHTGLTVGTDRVEIEGSILSATPPAEPGGPPDGQTAVRAIDLRVPNKGYVVTPPACPSGGSWRSYASFTFANGTTQTASAATPCSRKRSAGQR
jgi:hypothetical protein